MNVLGEGGSILVESIPALSGKYDVGVPSLDNSEKQESDQAQSKAAQEKRLALIKTIRHRVCEDYPELFNKADPKSLAIGIHKALFEKYPEYSHKHIRLMLKQWVRHRDYRKNLVTGTKRYDLDGKVTGEVQPTKKHKN